MIRCIQEFPTRVYEADSEEELLRFELFWEIVRLNEKNKINFVSDYIGGMAINQAFPFISASNTFLP